MTLVRLIRTVDAIPVHGSGADALDIAMPDLVGIFGQLDALFFGLALRVEEAELDFGCVRRKERKVDAVAVPDCTSRVRRTFAQTNGFVAHVISPRNTPQRPIGQQRSELLSALNQHREREVRKHIGYSDPLGAGLLSRGLLH